MKMRPNYANVFLCVQVLGGKYHDFFFKFTAVIHDTQVVNQTKNCSKYSSLRRSFLLVM